MGDAGGRNQVDHAFDETQAGAQDRREHQLLAGDFLAHHRRQRGLDLDIGKRQVAGHLVAQQHADLVQELAEALGRAVLVADQRQLVLDQGMGNDGDAVHGFSFQVRMV